MRGATPHVLLLSGTDAGSPDLLSDALFQQHLAPCHCTFLPVHCRVRSGSHARRCGCRAAPQPLPRHRRGFGIFPGRGRFLVCQMLVQRTSLQSRGLDHWAQFLDALDVLEHARLHALQVFVIILSDPRLRRGPELICTVASADRLLMAFVQNFCVFI